MSNKTTTSILEYAEVHRDFSMDDLFAYLHEKVGISKSSLSWYLLKMHWSEPDAECMLKS